MAASNSVLGYLKTGALADCLLAPFFLTAPLPEKFSSPRVLPLIFFISARITSRAASPADVRGLRRACFSLRFDLRVARFMGDNSFSGNITINGKIVQSEVARWRPALPICDVRIR